MIYIMLNKASAGFTNKTRALLSLDGITSEQKANLTNTIPNVVNLKHYGKSTAVDFFKRQCPLDLRLRNRQARRPHRSLVAGISLLPARMFLAFSVVILLTAACGGWPEPFPTSGSHFMVARFLTNGDVDTEFGRDGFVALEFSGHYSRANAVAVDDQRRIVLAGRANIPTEYGQIATARLHESGRPDARYGGGDGRLITRFPGNLRSYGSGVAVNRVAGALTTGFVVAGTNHHPGEYRFALAKFGEAELDRSFGSAGLVQTYFPDATAGITGGASDVAIDAHGRILVIGAHIQGFIVARYTSNGRLDRGFGSEGRAERVLPGATEWSGFSLAIDHSGRIVVGGMAFDATRNYRLALARYTERGRLDTSFGTGGVSLLDVGADGQALISDIAILPDGKIVTVGHAQMVGPDRLGFFRPVIARFNPDGTPDTAFRPRGYLYPTIATADWDWTISAVAVDRSGRFTVAGMGSFSGEDRIVLARYLPAGTLDPAFGTSGIKIAPFPDSVSLQVLDVTLDRFERIIVAGVVSR